MIFSQQAIRGFESPPSRQKQTGSYHIALENCYHYQSLFGQKSLLSYFYYLRVIRICPVLAPVAINLLAP